MADSKFKIDPVVYKMGKNKRGILAIIENHSFLDNKTKNYKINKGFQNAQQKDIEQYRKTFEKLKFTIQVHSNKKGEELKQLMKDYALTSHADYDCFMAVFLSHGTLENNEEYIKATDKLVALKELTDPFSTNKTLIGKPKIFFCDFCRGIEKEKRLAAYSASKSFRLFWNIDTREFKRKVNIPTDESSLNDFIFGFGCSK